MSDKRPDIEAERPDFERNALARGLSVDRNDTGSYLMAVSEYRWRGWKERARIAAEREREMQRQYDAEKQSRVKYQELAYATMNAIDSFLGLNVRRGEGTTVDSFKANLQRMLDEIKRILFDWANAEVESADVGLMEYISGWSALEILYWLHEKQAIPRRYDNARRQ